MKTRHILAWPRVSLLFLLLPLLPAPAQFVDVAAEVEFTEWYSVGAKPYHWVVRCVVGTNSWQMDGDFSSNARTTYWFTGTNIIEHSVVIKALPLDRPFEGAPIGAQTKRTSASVDGNPGTLSACLPDGSRRDVGPDRLCALGRVAWLAFCSGTCLKREGRQIFPPSDLWKELVCAPSGFSDRTTVFQDAFGLPKSVVLYTTNGQPVLQYSVTASTNVLGWEIPLEFYLAQYRPARLPDSRRFGGSGWELQLTAKGKVTAIGVGTKPQIPAE
jgi:hypothetical protein